MKTVDIISMKKLTAAWTQKQFTNNMFIIIIMIIFPSCKPFVFEKWDQEDPILEATG